jgi:hypothetical protein
MIIRASALALLAATLCLGQTPPQFTTASRLTNKEVVLKLTVESRAKFRIESSSNLLTWDPMSLLLSINPNTYTDNAAPYFPSRYYRAVQLSDAAAVTGDFLTTSDGTVLFHPINHATFVMQWKDLTIYNDPVGSVSTFTGIPKASLIFISHEHGDHFNASLLPSIMAPGAKIIATTTIYNSLSSALKASTIVLKNGQETNLLDLSVMAVPAYNTSNNNHPKGIGNGYVVTIGGKRIYMTGDSEDIPEMKALTDIDVSFV